MDAVEKKKKQRIIERINVRYNRVITSYVEAKYPEIYKEAREFYQELDMLYPEKSDLRRTNEFLRVKTGSSIKKYYNRVNYYQINKKDNSKRSKNRKQQINMDNMELVIPLMTIPEKTNQATSEEAQIEPSEVIESEEVQIEASEVIDMSEEGQIEVVVESEKETEAVEQPMTPAITCEPLPPIPDDMITTMIEELSKDPDLKMIFNDFEYNNDSPVEFNYEEETPLERELLMW